MEHNGYAVSASAYPDSEVDQVTIIGSIDVPAVSYGGDSILYNGPIDRLFYAVTDWDEEAGKPIGEIPQIYANQSAFDVRVVDTKQRVLKSVVVLITGVSAYSLGPGNRVQLRFAYKEIPKTISAGELFHLDVVVTHICKDPYSELIAIIVEGHPDARMHYINKNLMSFVHNGTVYHWKRADQYQRRIDRNLQGEEIYENAATVVYAHPDIAVTGFAITLDKFRTRMLWYLTQIYGRSGRIPEGEA